MQREKLAFFTFALSIIIYYSSWNISSLWAVKSFIFFCGEIQCGIHDQMLDSAQLRKNMATVLSFLCFTKAVLKRENTVPCSTNQSKIAKNRNQKIYSIIDKFIEIWSTQFPPLQRYIYIYIYISANDDHHPLKTHTHTRVNINACIC